MRNGKTGVDGRDADAVMEVDPDIGSTTRVPADTDGGRTRPRLLGAHDRMTAKVTGEINKRKTAFLGTLPNLRVNRNRRSWGVDMPKSMTKRNRRLQPMN